MPMKVLYVVGAGRSGSTLLGNLLAQTPQVSHAGELVTLWQVGLRADGRRCGCGELVISCPFWTEVAERLFGPDWTDADVGRVEALRREVVRSRYIPLRLASSRRSWARTAAGDGAGGRYARQLAELYEAIGATSGNRVVVDSSKQASTASFLPSVPQIDLYIVNLVRDPRGCAFSLAKTKPLPSGSIDAREGAINHTKRASKVARQWMERQVVSELLRARLPFDRWLTVRYEDVAADPQGTVDAIRRLLHEPPSPLAMADDGSIEFHATHTASGNPGRLSSGAISIRPDTKWRTELSQRQARSVTAITAPLLRRYGYPVRLGHR